MNSFLLSNKNNLRKHGIVYVWKFGKLTALKSCVSLLLAGVRGVGFGVEGELLIREAAHWCAGSTSTVFFT